MNADENDSNVIIPDLGPEATEPKFSNCELLNPKFKAKVPEDSSFTNSAEKPDHESPITKCLKNPGSRLILYSQPTSLRMQSSLTAFRYSFFFLLLLFSQRVGATALIIMIFHKVIETFGPLAAFMLASHLMAMGLNVYFLVSYGTINPEFRVYYVVEMFYSLGHSWVYLGYCLLLQETIQPATLALFAVPMIITSSFNFALCLYSQRILVPSTLYHVFESLQLLYIAFKIAAPDDNLSWDIVFMLYFAIAKILIWVSYAFMALMVVFIVTTCVIYYRNRISQVDLFVLFVGVVIGFFIWNAYCFRYTVHGIYDMMETFTSHSKLSELQVNYTLYSISIVNLIFSIFTLIVIFLFYQKMKTLIEPQITSAQAPSVISLASFAENLKIRLKQVSSNYYRRNDAFKTEEDDQPEKEKEAASEVCTVCWDKTSEVMIDPCGHSGFCVECMTNCIREKDKCPICRQVMKQVYLISYDGLKKCYMASGVINFS
jgi:hypothetical protein